MYIPFFFGNVEKFLHMLRLISMQIMSKLIENNVQIEKGGQYNFPKHTEVSKIIKIYIYFLCWLQDLLITHSLYLRTCANTSVLKVR